MAEDRVVATNRRARHEYEILETLEAGIVLRGTEVKALRTGQVNFKDAYAAVRGGEAWLLGCHISPYSHGTDANHDPERDRKLLLHGREITRLTGKVAERGLTIVPLKVYFFLKLFGHRYVLTNRTISIWKAIGEQLVVRAALPDVSEIVIRQQPGQEFYVAADLDLLDSKGERLFVLEGVRHPQRFRHLILDTRDALLNVQKSLAVIENRKSA